MTISRKKRRWYFRTVAQKLVAWLIQQHRIGIGNKSGQLVDDDGDQAWADGRGAACKAATIVFAGQAAVEIMDRTGAAGTAKRTESRARTVLRKQGIDPESVDILINRFRISTELLITECWPAIELIVRDLVTGSDLSFVDIDLHIDRAMARLETAHAYALAARAVSAERLGGRTEGIILHGSGLSGATNLFGEAYVQLPWSDALSRARQRRDIWSQHPMFLDQYQAHMTSIAWIVHDIHRGRATLLQLAEAWDRYERSLDQLAGPLDPSVRTDFTDWTELGAVILLTNEAAAAKATGLTIPCANAHASYLQNLAILQLSPREAVDQLMAARTMASVLVEENWIAIHTVARELLQETALTGDEVRQLITQSNLPSSDLAA